MTGGTPTEYLMTFFGGGSQDQHRYLLWSPIGRDVLNFDVAAPFGLRDDIWSLLLLRRQL